VTSDDSKLAVFAFQLVPLLFVSLPDETGEAKAIFHRGSKLLDTLSSGNPVAC